MHEKSTKTVGFTWFTIIFRPSLSTLFRIPFICFCVVTVLVLKSEFCFIYFPINVHYSWGAAMETLISDLHIHSSQLYFPGHRRNRIQVIIESNSLQSKVKSFTNYLLSLSMCTQKMLHIRQWYCLLMFLELLIIFQTTFQSCCTISLGLEIFLDGITTFCPKNHRNMYLP